MCLKISILSNNNLVTRPVAKNVPSFDKHNTPSVKSTNRLGYELCFIICILRYCYILIQFGKSKYYKGNIIYIK